MKNKLEQTVSLMISNNCKARFVAEYRQLKIRYDELRDLNNKVEMPVHDSPEHLLKDQEHTMQTYLRILEKRAIIEGINLQEEMEHIEENQKKAIINTEKCKNCKHFAVSVFDEHGPCYNCITTVEKIHFEEW